MGQENEAAAQSADAGRLRDVVARCNALGSERARTTFSTKNLEQDLARLLRSGNVEQHRDVLERPLASAALAGGRMSSCHACPLLPSAILQTEVVLRGNLKHMPFV